MPEEKIPIYVAKDLYEEVKKKVKLSRGEFRSVEEYVEFVLREIVGEKKAEQVYSPGEEKEVRQRLRKLGYL